MKRITYDFHIHSCLSPCGDNDMTPANIVGMSDFLGLDAIAVTDHNSCRNLEAVIHAAKDTSLIIIPGMELTTMEEVHVLCYFANYDNAMQFSEYVERHSPFIKNNPEFFGEQIIYDNNDTICGYEKRLLHTASEISFDNVFDLLKDFNGVMVPAHINKSTASLLSNLGFIPENSQFASAEIQTINQIGVLTEKYPYLQKCHILSSSDAHYLKDILNPIRFLHVQEKSVSEVLNVLNNKINVIDKY